MKNRFLSVLLIWTCLLWIFPGCKTAYVPNSINVPLFDDAGQMRLSGDTQGNIQFAASLDRRFGFMANAMFRKDGGPPDAVYGKGHFFEAGLGGFSYGNDLVRWETYIGGGFGTTKTYDNGKKFEATGARFFFQPSIGLHHKIFEVAFTPRLVAGKYKKPVTTYSIAELASNKLLDLEKPTWIFAEPALTFRIGYEWVKLQVQLGKSFKLTDKPIAFDNNLNSVGFIFDFGR